jgi:hypothetical protein
MTADSLIANYIDVLNTGDYQLVNFKIAATIEGYDKIEPTKTAVLTEKQIALIRKVDVGARLMFFEIYGKNKQGKEKKFKCHSIIIK